MLGNPIFLRKGYQTASRYAFTHQIRGKRLSREDEEHQNNVVQASKKCEDFEGLQ